MMRRSLTLIEVTLGVVVLGFCLVPVVKGFADGARGTIDTTQSSVAGFLVTERMEQIIAARYRNSSGYGNLTASSYTNEPSVSGFSTFARSVEITEVGADLATPEADSGIKRVTVTVSWNGGAKRMQLVRLFTDY
mgnify:CR=1 FL=1